MPDERLRPEGRGGSYRRDSRLYRASCLCAQGKTQGKRVLERNKVRLGNAPHDYKIPQRFFDRTFLTEHLAGMAAGVMRRLSGNATETSAVFNMSTQFDGGKTHALTLLYHLARNGSAANRRRGVSRILERAGVRSVPDHCAIAVFAGTEFDSVTGRGGDDGTPRRRTPWGEIAWQLGQAAAFSHVAKHDADDQEPKGDVIEGRTS